MARVIDLNDYKRKLSAKAASSPAVPKKTPDAPSAPVLPFPKQEESLREVLKDRIKARNPGLTDEDLELHLELYGI